MIDFPDNTDTIIEKYKTLLIRLREHFKGNRHVNLSNDNVPPYKSYLTTEIFVI